MKVQRGEIWRVGQAIVACADLVESLTPTLLAARFHPELTYMDPPWNQRVLRQFAEQAGSNPHDMAELAGALIPLLDASRRAAFLEHSKRGELLECMMDCGKAPIRTWAVSYRGGRYESRLSMFLAKSLIQNQYPTIPAGTDDSETPGLCVDHCTMPGELVADWCCGRGITALAAVTRGRRFIGSDVNPQRVAQCLHRLQRAQEDVDMEQLCLQDLVATV